MAKGITTAQALSYNTRQINQMTTKTLSKVVSVMRSTSRKRYERLEESGVYSPAMNYMVKSTKGETIFPTVKGMDRVALINEYKRQKTFLEQKTSTVKGARESQEEKRQQISEMFSTEFTDEETTEIWEMVDELQQGEFGGAINYKQIGDTVANVMTEYKEKGKPLTRQELFKKAKKRLSKIYEDEQRPNKVYASQFFD